MPMWTSMVWPSTGSGDLRRVCSCGVHEACQACSMLTAASMALTGISCSGLFMWSTSAMTCSRVLQTERCRCRCGHVSCALSGPMRYNGSFFFCTLSPMCWNIEGAYETCTSQGYINVDEQRSCNECGFESSFMLTVLMCCLTI